MGRKLLIMPPYQPVEYHGDMGREIERRSDMYRDVDMRSAPYRGSGGYNDRAGVMRMGGYDGGDVRMGGSYYYEDPRYPDYYAPEMRRGRDSRGRYTSVRSEYEPEMARRRRRSDGTYMSMGDYDEPGMTGGRYEPQYPSPVYERDEREDYRPMNKIGFAVEGEMEHRSSEVRHEYPREAEYRPTDEMGKRSAPRMSGYAQSESVMPMTRQKALEWASCLENEDGTTGPHWNMDQTNKVMAQKQIEASPVDFFLALNLTYSDLCKEFKKHGINNMDAYVDFARAFWLDDQDVQPDKLALYYEYIAK